MKNPERKALGVFLFFLFVNSVLLCNWVEFLELKLLVSELLLILSCVVSMTFSDTF